jgi:hypothetical protein
VLLSASEKKRPCYKVELSVDAPTRRGCSINSVINPWKNYATAKNKYDLPPKAFCVTVASLCDSEGFFVSNAHQCDRCRKEKPPEPGAVSARQIGRNSLKANER